MDLNVWAYGDNRNGLDWERFSTSIRFGDGDIRICFRQDPWCGEVILKEAYPVLFQIVQTKVASVGEFNALE